MNNILIKNELANIVGGSGHLVPIYNEEGKIIGWEYVEDPPND